MVARRSLTVLVACAVVLPALALPAAAGAVSPGGPVVVASLVRTDDGGIEVVRTRADSAAQGRSLAARLRSEPDVLDLASLEGPDSELPVLAEAVSLIEGLVDESAVSTGPDGTSITMRWRRAG